MTVSSVIGYWPFPGPAADRRREVRQTTSPPRAGHVVCLPQGCDGSLAGAAREAARIGHKMWDSGGKFCLRDFARSARERIRRVGQIVPADPLLKCASVRRERPITEFPRIVKPKNSCSTFVAGRRFTTSLARWTACSGGTSSSLAARCAGSAIVTRLRPTAVSPGSYLPPPCRRPSRNGFR